VYCRKDGGEDGGDLYIRLTKETPARGEVATVRKIKFQPSEGEILLSPTSGEA